MSRFFDCALACRLLKPPSRASREYLASVKGARSPRSSSLSYVSSLLVPGHALNEPSPIPPFTPARTPTLIPRLSPRWKTTSTASVRVPRSFHLTDQPRSTLFFLLSSLSVSLSLFIASLVSSSPRSSLGTHASRVSRQEATSPRPRCMSLVNTTL